MIEVGPGQEIVMIIKGMNPTEGAWSFFGKNDKQGTCVHGGRECIATVTRRNDDSITAKIVAISTNKTQIDVDRTEVRFKMLMPVEILSVTVCRCVVFEDGRIVKEIKDSGYSLRFLFLDGSEILLPYGQEFQAKTEWRISPQATKFEDKP